jgi:hypothetical protein
LSKCFYLKVGEQLQGAPFGPKKNSFEASNKKKHCFLKNYEPLYNKKQMNLFSFFFETPIVRHEAGEALAAIGDFSVIPLLEEFAQDEVKEVAGKCYYFFRQFFSIFFYFKTNQNPHSLIFLVDERKRAFEEPEFNIFVPLSPQKMVIRLFLKKHVRKPLIFTF